MTKYIIKRLLLAVLTVFIICAITFFLMHAIPGGPFNREKALDPATIAALNARYNLDKPLLVQFGIYIKELFKGDFGVSLKNGREISSIISESFPISCKVGLRAISIALICGTVFGSIAALMRNKWPDRVIVFLSTLFTAVPSFVLATLLLLVFCIKLGWVPVWSPNNPSYVLPVIALSAYPMAYITRLSKTSMLDALSQDYIRTAKAKGVHKWTVIFKHALRNSLIPVITYAGPQIAYIITGSMIVETIFTIGGIGSKFVSAITNRDYTMIMATTIFLATLMVAATLICDLLYKFAPSTEEEKRQQDVMSKSTTFFRDGMRKLFKNPLAVGSLIVLSLIIITIIVAPMIVPYKYSEILSVNGRRDKGAKNMAPFTYSEMEQEYIAQGGQRFPHIFGTDEQCRDYFVRVIYGTRVSLCVGLFASIIVMIIGVIYGSISGYLGGKVDLIMMRIVDIIYSLPDMLMVILLAVVFDELIHFPNGSLLNKLGANMISLFLVFGLLYWVGMARLIRGQILSIKENDYILAAESIGAGSGRIIRKHILPNCISVIIITTALQIPSAIFTESYLSFIGMGVRAPMPSLGSLANYARDGLQSYPYKLVFPALTICLIVLSMNLLGDGLRDAFDPKLKR